MTHAAHAERSSLQRRTLVLNADGRPLCAWPLSLISPQEAISAVWRERAEVVEAWPDAFFRSPSVTLPVPKVVMLRQYVPISGEPKFCRRSILLRDRFRCQFCGVQFPSPELTFDHVRPRARGGRTEWTNIVSACVRCNAAKADGASMRPLRSPRRPTNVELLRAGLEFLPNDIREDFKSWLYWSEELRA